MRRRNGETDKRQRSDPEMTKRRNSNGKISLRVIRLYIFSPSSTPLSLARVLPVLNLFNRFFTALSLSLSRALRFLKRDKVELIFRF